MMNKRTFLSLVVCLVWLLGTAGASAQTTAAAWRIALFDSSTGAISTLTPNGLEIGPTLQIPDLDKLQKALLSPDGRYLVFSIVSPDQQGNYTQESIYVADLTTQTCCRQLQDPLNSVMDIYILGTFSPDGTQVVASLTSTKVVYEQANITGLISVFDVASGTVVASTSVTNLQSEYPPQVAVFGLWKQDGIRLAAGCFGCEGIWEGEYQVWDPVTNVLGPPTEPFDIFTSELPATGELISAIENTNYPVSGAPMMYFPPANVVEYYSSGQAPGQVVYYNPANKYVYHAEWVLDGNAFIVNLGGPMKIDPGADYPYPDQNGESYLVLRDGRQVQLSPDIAEVFAATPDGWLSRNPEDGSVLYNQVVNGEVHTTLLATGAGDRVILTSFVLGVSATGTFPTVPPPVPTACPGFLPSRLSVNTAAKVTPGASNNVRSQPSQSSPKIGEIPGDGTFIVLAGPTCADNMAWWQVNYNGLIGWTSEGQGNTYWLEPLTSSE